MVWSTLVSMTFWKSKQMHGLFEPFGCPFVHSHKNAADNVHNAILFYHLVGISLRFLLGFIGLVPATSLQVDKMEQFSIPSVGVHINIDYNDVVMLKYS